METFTARHMDGSTKEIEILESFKVYGQEFVVHLSFQEGSFAVSHRETGTYVCYAADTAEAAKKAARSRLLKNGEAVLLAAIAKRKEKVGVA